jgi:hypothetical protein
LLESSVVRPRQARYQAALRPDMKCTIDSKALSNFTATPLLSTGIRSRKTWRLSDSNGVMEFPNG